MRRIVLFTLFASLTGCTYSQSLHRAEKSATGERWVDALAFYEKALAARPDSIEAKDGYHKARSAAITHRSGKVWEDTLKQRPGMVKFPDAFAVQGGLAILHQGEVIGAVGVSGVQSHEDEQVAAASIAALGL